MISITDPADPRVAGYRDIRERDLRGREGLYVVEGEVVLAKVLHAPHHRLQSLLIADKRLHTLRDLLAVVPAGIPIYAANQAVLDSIAGFPLHRGILALAAPPPALTLDSVLSTARLVLGLFGIANHDNMGGIFRNAAAFGVDAVLLDSDCCDPLYRKAIRVSVGASLLVPTVRLPRGLATLEVLQPYGFTALALSPSGRHRLVETPRYPRTAVLLGSEGPGLPSALLAGCQTVSIPMHGGFDSLNVATTSGIVLHHLTNTTGIRAG